MSSKGEKPASAMQDETRQTLELSRRIPLAKVGRPLEETVEASEKERQALMERFGLLSLAELVCTFRIKEGKGNTVLADGHLHAQVEQPCIITGEPVAEIIDEHFHLRFVPESEMLNDDEIDIEALLQEEADDVPHDGRAIDLGEATAEQLALCLDPYPRRAGSGLDSFVDVTPSDDKLDEQSAAAKESPFAALKKLQEKQ